MKTGPFTALAIAKERGIEMVWSVPLAENATVLRVARKLGFTVA